MRRNNIVKEKGTEYPQVEIRERPKIIESPDVIYTDRLLNIEGFKDIQEVAGENLLISSADIKPEDGPLTDHAFWLNANFEWRLVRYHYRNLYLVPLRKEYC
uniref:Uncharacterized protein n=1 Tax=viral metagenome TaxID=1070528 RepID=A0A6M3JC35_9ZZZZ